MLKTILGIIEGVAILGMVGGFIILDYLFGDN
jgi:F0F1-type ATP synthase membrane subunit c/vacuolar-type H+-ATPase subunit K